jgi:RHS repeat-associated protein
MQVEFVRGSGQGGGIGSILYADRSAYSGSGPVEHYTFNAVGHTVALTDATGSVTSTNLYEAFGGIVASTGSSDNDKLANTKERDFSIELDNHGFRYYDPATGRYITRDPAGEPDGPNNFLYVVFVGGGGMRRWAARAGWPGAGRGRIMVGKRARCRRPVGDRRGFTGVR